MIRITSLLLMCFLGITLARYEAVPIEDVIDMRELMQLRQPREVEAIGAVRGPGHKDEKYVDFGAQTGAQGSYGWYVDFPVYRQQN